MTSADKSKSILKKTSLVFLVFCICLTSLTMDFWRPWHKGHSFENIKHTPFLYDVAQYYSYLPALLQKDYSMNFNHVSVGYLHDAPNGQKMPKTTYGMSILYAPFFALGYKIAINERQPTDGFSDPFATAIHWGSIFYSLLGLLFLRNFLIKFYSELVVTFTLSSIYLGTNLFFYSTGWNEMSHAYLFMLISALLLCTYNWYQKITWGRSILIGFLLGIISLIRPTEVLVFILFAFWMVDSISAFQQRVILFLKNYFHVLAIIISAIVIWIPQFIFWHYKTGHYFHFSYPGERFFWNDPQILNILFSYRKGWFVYTPIMLLSFIGFFFLKNELKPIRIWLIGLTLINIYMLSCWWDWFFGGSFGARCFVQHYAFLAIPLASFFQFSIEKIQTISKQILQLLIVIFTFSCISLNLIQTYQYNEGMIHPNSMTKEAYWYSFGVFKFNDYQRGKFWGYLKEPDYVKLKSGENRNQ